MAQPQQDQAAPVDPEDNQEGEDPVRAQTKAAAPEALERDSNPVEAGPLEEKDEAQLPDPAEEPTSEEPQAQASEQDQSTGHPAVQEKPTSKPETESETPAEASEPDQPDHRNLETQTQASDQQGLALERPFRRPDAARQIDLVQASIAMENSSAMALWESYSSDHHLPPEKAQMEEDRKGKAELLAPAGTGPLASSSGSKSKAE